MDELATLIRKRNIVRYCEKCGKRMTYTAVHGIYNCKDCGISILDTYGRMKELLEDNPNLTKAQISRMLHVPMREINSYIHDGILENPNPDQ